ncbi:putative adhesin [Kitasatospora purpeofusca]|uniref:putative adhesin n=1 Tax=Kitasatospora purpeofusca TaxID=67352 RepID=UPI00224E66C8|nr:hypothetical protein [Kitasatospora purpeofusca]MCX4757010.1 hypothetical protein [Kitasatospora purpeofusca]WSR35224.1 hypothetical protein OG715_32260 [Kitasatospora purpeofusca]WSR43545.1 hypothetical protein OG196_33305 [Kitasatospora purpeofusca]
MSKGTTLKFHVKDGEELGQIDALNVELGGFPQPKIAQVVKPGKTVQDCTLFPGENLEMSVESTTVSNAMRLSGILKENTAIVPVAICRKWSNS